MSQPAPPLPRYEFCSPEWLAALHATFAACLAAAAADEQPPASFSMCEVCDNAPTHIARGAARVGWGAVVRDGRLERFVSGELAEADFKVIAEYQALIELSRFEVGDSAERLADYRELTRLQGEQGRIRAEGKRPRFPKAFAGLHDAMAALTL